jgi:formate dehydrogenase alpha subunit
MTRLQAVIDGHPVEIHDAETILVAARRAGIDIPTLCYAGGLEPEGGCRVCLVEVDGAPRPVGACHTPIRPGMEVRTATPRIEALRRDILSLQVAVVGSPAPNSELDKLLARYAVVNSSEAAPAAKPLEATHPYLRLDPSICITCRRCLRACEEIQGQFVYGVAGRGAGSHLIVGSDDRFVDSTCTACGACVDQCPTGAVTDADRGAGEAPDSSTHSVCGYCGVGCRIEVEEKNGRVLRIRGVEQAAVNRGHLCSKGRYAHAWHRSPDRLTQPLVRDNGALKPIAWSDAIALLAERLMRIRDAHGADALGVFTSSRSTNEAAYLLQKLFRTEIGTNNVDCCARVCHSSTALALQTVTGTGAASASYADIDRAASIVLAGANPTEAHPVVGARIKQAVLRGARLLVIDPRRIELADYAELHLQLRPGTNVALFNALAKLLIEGKTVDDVYLDERVEGFREFRDFTAGVSLDEAARETGISVARIRAAASFLGGAGKVLFVHGLGLTELTQGTASVMTLCNLGMLTGSIGFAGAGMLPLRGQNNVQGNADMGSMPNLLTGYQPLAEDSSRARVERLWGKAPPPRAGLTIPEMIDAAVAGKVRALWIQGEDVVQSDPHESHVIEALEALDFLVVQEMFLSETARYAHLILPAAGALEQTGTFTNGERRIQLVRPAVDPPGEARPDWMVIRDVAAAMGATARYSDPSDVMDEIARVAPQLFGGVSYDRLEGDGLQWPCPSADHPGTATVHAGRFLRGKGRLMAVAYRRSPELAVEGFPYTLVTGRVLEHYNVGTMTRRTPNRELVRQDLLEIHPDDALREAIQEGSDVVVESRWGCIRTAARISTRVAPGTLFLSFHFPESHTNRLTGPQLDPDSKCPEYKVTAVRLQAT